MFTFHRFLMVNHELRIDKINFLKFSNQICLLPSIILIPMNPPQWMVSWFSPDLVSENMDYANLKYFESSYCYDLIKEDLSWSFIIFPHFKQQVFIIFAYFFKELYSTSTTSIRYMIPMSCREIIWICYKLVNKRRNYTPLSKAIYL